MRSAQWVARSVLVLALSGVLSAPLTARPHVPANDAEVLAKLPPGARHAESGAQRLARGRLDVAVPLAQFYIGQARVTGDLRFLGYAEAVLASWVAQSTPAPAALVLQATLQQSRHEFTAALTTLDRSLAAKSDDPQAWLTRATVLRVLGRYTEAQAACLQFAHLADAGVGMICRLGVEGLSGHLEGAYSALEQLSTQDMLGAELAWRTSELGEMAVRLGRDAESERWFRRDLDLDPHDFYARAALADLLLRQHRDAEVLVLLKGQESIEPLLLRLAIAQKHLRDPNFNQSRDSLQAAFDVEAERGEAVHRREQARFLLDVQDQPRQSLAAALANWAVQREPDDALILADAARRTGDWRQAAPALEIARAQGLRDARLAGPPGGPS